MTEEKKSQRTLFLIDGSSYVYRAYHAIRGLTTREGFPTNAILGFANMMQKVLRDHAPTHVAVVLDAPGPTFRHQISARYKATRPPMPEDLKVQLPLISGLVEAFRVAVLQQQGVEADDIIATLARRFAPQFDRVVIISSDKDLMPLVSDRVLMLDTMKDRWIGVGEVRERFGVEPSQVADVLALAGDSSDNIPGVRGVGAKTASRLIAEYGDIDTLLDHLAEVGGRTGHALAAGAEDLRLSRALVALKDDLALEVDPDELQVREPDLESLRQLFTELEFTRLLNDMAPRTALGREGYRTVLTVEDLEGLARSLRGAGRFALDVETDSLDSMRANLVGVSFSWAEGIAAYVPLRHSYLGAPNQVSFEEAGRILAPLLADPAVEKIGQNIKYDLVVLERAGWTVDGISFDTMVASWLLDPSRRSHGLAEIASNRLGHTMISYSDVTGKGRSQIPFAQVAVQDASVYSCEDADVTLRVAGPLRLDMEEKDLLRLFEEVEMPLLGVLAAMEQKGVLLDTALLSDLSREVECSLREIETRIHQEAGRPFNINSPRQLGEVLFRDLGLPALKKTKTGYSTNDDVLLELSSRHHLPAMVREYRSLAKLKSTYIDALPAIVNPETGRVHTSFNQTATATGRLSSSDPNLQNIPVRTDLGRRIREAFIAPPGRVLLSADYSQVELRILAHLSGDANLLEAFSRGEDVHARTAREVLGAGDPVEPELRRRAKVVNFGIIYGMSAFGLSRELGIHPREAADIIDGYFAVYSGVKKYLDGTLEDAREKGYVTTLLNRRRYLPELSSTNPAQRQLGERMAINTPVQGTAADLIKLAMLRISRDMIQARAGMSMVLQVHDELLFEVEDDWVDRARDLVQSAMKEVMELSVPLVVDVGVGGNWARAH